MTQQRHEDAWLSSIMPGAWPGADCTRSCEPLELHKRLLHLATLREAALQHLGQLDAVKVALTERKATQQGRLLAALDARLASALTAVDPHRRAAWDLVKALEKEAAFYSDVLKGLAHSPPAEQWVGLTQRYQQLQQRVQQQQEQVVQPSDLEQTLAASLQPCQLDHVQLVEQLRTQVDSLTQQLQQAHAAQQQQQEAAEQLQLPHCQQELSAMQQLAALVRQQLQTYHSLQTGEHQQLRHPGAAAALKPCPHQQQEQQHQQQHALACPAELHAVGREAARCQQLSGATSSSSLHAQCCTLRQQLQQLSDAADALVQLAHCSTSRHAAAEPSRPAASSNSAQLDWLSQELSDPLEGSGVAPDGALAADQQLKEALQGLALPSQQQQQQQQQQPPLQGMSVRLHHSLHQQGGSSGGGDSSNAQLQVVKLRMAYQQMLHKVQARYQQDLRQLELKHQEALQAHSHSQQQAMADLVKQHQEACGRLAAAATAEAGMQQQLERLNADKQALQQQVDKLQREVSGAAASALAVVQVQHEQQLLAAKQEQEQMLKDAKQQVEALQQQLHDLQQQAVQQASALPLAETVAALVAEATAKQSNQQLEQLEATYQAALQQREQQHMSLLSELAELRQLQDEASALSNSSAATDVTAAMPVASTGTAAEAGAAAPAPAGAAGGGAAAASESSLPASASGALGRPCSTSSAAGQASSAGMQGGQRLRSQQELSDLIAGTASSAGGSSSSLNGHAASTAASAAEQQRILAMVDSTGSLCQPAQQAEAVTAEGQHHQPQQQQQQQREQDHCAASEEDAMGALIAAVLGPGRIGRAQQQLHQERLAAAQHEQQQQQQQQHKRALQQPIQPLDLQEELDKLLGLGGSRATQGSTSSSRNSRPAGSSGTRDALERLTGCDYSSAGLLAPANAQVAAALARTRVAETCLPALQDISCASICNKPSAAAGVGTTPSCSGDGGMAVRPPWKPVPASGRVASPQRQQQQQQCQQWQQWQQLPRAGGSSSPSRARSRTPSPSGPRQGGTQQRAAGQALPVLQCVRCGQQEGDELGPCCFHPGLVAAPGPLMYGPEWHACRARCVPSSPGCYTRKDHFFHPCSHPAGPSSSTAGTTHSGPPSASGRATAVAAVARSGGKPAAAAAAEGGSPRLAGAGALGSRPASSPSRAASSSSRAGGKGCGSAVAPGLSPPWAVATGRYVGPGSAVGQQGVGAGSSSSSRHSPSRAPGGPREPEPRGSVPKPSVWRG